MAAFTAVNRVDDFAYTPQQNIGHAMTTFLAQNKGAGHKERMKKGFQTGLLIELVYSIGLFAVIRGLAPQIMTLFAEDGDAQVVSLGISYLHLISWMYILPGMTNGIQGFFRHRRSEGDTVQHLCEYVGQSCGGIRDAASAAYGLRQSGVGQHDRLDRLLLFEIPLLVKSLQR